MQRPQGGAEPGRARADFFEHAPEQHGRPRVKRDVEQVIWKRIEPGDFVNEPKRGEHERVVDRLRARPDVAEA